VVGPPGAPAAPPRPAFASLRSDGRRCLDQKSDLLLIDRCRRIVDDHLQIRPPVDREGRFLVASID
jgi:hypothetical protein